MSLMGVSALYDNQAGADNSAFGAGAMSVNTGSWNTAVGRNALDNNQGGTHLTGFGWNANVVNPGMDDANAIGFNALVLANGSTMIGDVWQNHIGGWADWTKLLGRKVHFQCSGRCEGAWVYFKTASGHIQY